MSAPRAPKGLGASGRRLWRSVTAEFDLSDAEELLLGEACRTLDELDALAAVTAARGVLDAEADRAAPWVVESRQLRLALARLLASLRLPADDGSVPQRRGAARGAYGGQS